MTFKTKLHKADPNKESIRTTVPIYIVKQLGLDEGDTFDWFLDEGKITVVPIKKEGKN